MPLPLLATKLLTMNARVNSFLTPEDQDSRAIQSGSGQLSGKGNVESQIAQAYKQIFFHAFKVDREPALESQLQNGQITMRDFVRGLLLSSKFRDDFYRCNSNYRIVEQVVNRVLGRPVHGNHERLAYSIMIAEHGLGAFIDSLLDSEEYMNTFGYNTVPYQRSRTLPGQALGTMPFNQQAPATTAPGGTKPPCELQPRWSGITPLANERPGSPTLRHHGLKSCGKIQWRPVVLWSQDSCFGLQLPC